MKDSTVANRSELIGLAGKFQRYQLALACVLIALCFALGNDYYRAKAMVLKNKDILPRMNRVINYGDLARRKTFNDTYRSDLNRRYLIDPKAAKQKPLISALFAGADNCDTAPLIGALPFNDTSSTANLVDDYNISVDPTLATSCPTCTCPACTVTSGGFPDRGLTYDGTGTGPDAAYKIRFNQTSSLLITLDPTDASPSDDMALIFYGGVCSNGPLTDPTDAIAVADNSGSGNPPFPSGPLDNVETLSITNIPAGQYNIVVDGYTAPSDAATSGGYTLSVDCVPSATCSQPVPRRPRRTF